MASEQASPLWVSLVWNLPYPNVAKALAACDAAAVRSQWLLPSEFCDLCVEASRPAWLL